MSNMNVLKVQVHCTDGGQHPSLLVCRVEMNPEVRDHGAAKWAVVTGGGRRNIAQLADANHRQRDTPTSGMAPQFTTNETSRPWSSFTFDCPKCRRHALVNADRLETLIVGLAAAGRSRIELSSLERL